MAIENNTKEATIIGKPVEKSFGDRFKNAFRPDDIRTIGANLVKNQIIPMCKNTLINFVNSTMYSILYPGQAPRNNTFFNQNPIYRGQNSTYFSYNNVQSGSNVVQFQQYGGSATCRDMWVSSYEDYQKIAQDCSDIMEAKGQLRVSEYLRLFKGVQPSWSDQQNGWTDISGMQAIPSPSATEPGWIIKMPPICRLIG